MITRAVDTKTVKVTNKITRRMVVCGQKCQIIEFVLEKGAVIPAHRHPHEQIGYVQKGKLKMLIDGQISILTQGDGYWIEPNVEHEVEVLEDSIAIDVFSPPREDFKT
ncbi:MAG: cupin domain-containing protein [Methanomassiliicoccales archaeon]|jgi:quercetin dioxygenase-like cupin family protein|nr:cupin domain-containing protein [Methanomassiliicoccales archaeon]